LRKIIHIDMDAFYASIEQRDHPEYRGKALAVGYSEARGVVAAASYEARQFGVFSAMASQTALRKCPELIFVSPRSGVYRSVSEQIMKILSEYTDLVEPLSLDEAFLDVTKNKKNITSATEIAREIKQKIRENTQLTASAGVSYNKFLAKIASDFRKPDGLFVIKPRDAEKFIENLNIERFFGVGKVTAKKMHESGIRNGFDLKQRSEEELVHLFGKAGHIYYQNARGIDLREVTPDRITKSIGAETTFDRDKNDLLSLIMELYHIAKEVMHRMESESLFGRTLTLKIKYADFKIITRSKTLPERMTNFKTLLDTSKEMLKKVDLTDKQVRLLGLSVSHFDELPLDQDMQLSFDFDD